MESLAPIDIKADILLFLLDFTVHSLSCHSFVDDAVLTQVFLLDVWNFITSFVLARAHFLSFIVGLVAKLRGASHLLVVEG